MVDQGGEHPLARREWAREEERREMVVEQI
jgi:hypothetical protein